MKTKITVIVSVITAVLTSIASAQVPVITSYASTSPALEASLSGLDNRFEVPDTSVTGISLVSFASKVSFPVGTTSATVNSVSFSLIRRINGVQTTQLSNISMNSSAWAVEGGTGRPAIFARDASSAIIALSGGFANKPMPNVRSLFITDHKIILGGTGNPPKMVKEDDFYKITRSINVSWTVSGLTQSITLSTESEVVIWFYPTNPPVISSVGLDEGTFQVYVSGVTPSSYGKTWFIQTSTKVGLDTSPWVSATNGTVSGNTVISFPVIEGESQRFWRVQSILNPSPPQT